MTAHGRGLKCEDVMTRMRLDGVEPDIASWTTLMNAHVNGGEGVDKYEELMARMRIDRTDPDVTSWNTTMKAQLNARGGAKCKELIVWSCSRRVFMDHADTVF
jgi:hypothetical protein